MGSHLEELFAEMQLCDTDEVDDVSCVPVARQAVTVAFEGARRVGGEPPDTVFGARFGWAAVDGIERVACIIMMVTRSSAVR